LQAFLALDSTGRCVGRIAAIDDRDAQAAHGDRLGAFGYLHAVDDREVTSLLMRQAGAWLAARGMTGMRGPFECSINQECGLLVDGFGESSFVRTPGSAPWVCKHLEALGFQSEAELLGWQVEPREALARLPAKDAMPVQLQRIRLHRWDEEVQRLARTYNEAWSAQWGAVPVGHDEARFVGKLMRPLARPGWIAFAVWQGETIGVAAMLPDLHWASRDLGGRLLPFGWASLVWRLRPGGVRRARLPIYGIVPGKRRSPIGHAAADLLLRHVLVVALAAGVRTLEISWVLAENQPMRRRMESIGARVARHWKIYRSANVSG